MVWGAWLLLPFIFTLQNIWLHCGCIIWGGGVSLQVWKPLGGGPLEACVLWLVVQCWSVAGGDEMRPNTSHTLLCSLPKLTTASDVWSITYHSYMLVITGNNTDNTNKREKGNWEISAPSKSITCTASVSRVSPFLPRPCRASPTQYSGLDYDWQWGQAAPTYCSCSSFCCVVGGGGGGFLWKLVD